MHRCFCVELSGNYSLEKEYCDSYIRMDNKNIHSWSHRLWVVQTYNLWDGELEYTDRKNRNSINDQIIWILIFLIIVLGLIVFLYLLISMQIFMIHSMILQEASQQIPDEIEYTIEKLNKAPHNEACWNYIPGLMKHYENQAFNDIAYEAKRLLVIIGVIYNIE